MNSSTVFGEVGGIKILDHSGACINCAGGAESQLSKMYHLVQKKTSRKHTVSTVFWLMNRGFECLKTGLTLASEEKSLR